MQCVPSLWSIRGLESTTHLIPDVLVDELVDRHKRLGPLLIRVPGPDLHGDGAAASNFLDVLQTIRKTGVSIAIVMLRLAGRPASHWAPFIGTKAHKVEGDPTSLQMQVQRGEVTCPPGTGQLFADKTDESGSCWAALFSSWPRASQLLFRMPRCKQRDLIWARGGEYRLVRCLVSQLWWGATSSPACHPPGDPWQVSSPL